MSDGQQFEELINLLVLVEDLVKRYDGFRETYQLVTRGKLDPAKDLTRETSEEYTRFMEALKMKDKLVEPIPADVPKERQQPIKESNSVQMPETEKDESVETLIRMVLRDKAFLNIDDFHNQYVSVCKMRTVGKMFEKFAQNNSGYALIENRIFDLAKIADLLRLPQGALKQWDVRPVNNELAKKYPAETFRLTEGQWNRLKVAIAEYTKSGTLNGRSL